jgi:hypothetical protein
LCVDEFGFEILQVSVIEAKLPLQCPVRYTLPLAEEVNNLIEESVKVHLVPSCLCRGESRPTTAHPQERGYVPYVPPMTGEGKHQVLGAQCAEEALPPRRAERAVAVRVCILQPSVSLLQTTSARFIQGVRYVPKHTIHKKPAKASNRLRLKARERLERDRLQAQQAAKALEQALSGTWASPQSWWRRS